MRWVLHLYLAIDRFKCSVIIIERLFAFCCFRAMSLTLLHLVVNWQVFTININVI